MPFVLAGTVTAPTARRGAARAPRRGERDAGRRRRRLPPDGRGWDFTGYVADFYREGANVVVLYEVRRDGSRSPSTRSP